MKRGGVVGHKLLTTTTYHTQRTPGLVMTECITSTFLFHDLGRREVTARFDGGAITSDAGGLLLRELEAKTHILANFARCFEDFRDPETIEFTVEELLKQRIFALCLGYEDVNDHDTLRLDPLLATLVGRADPTGADRIAQRDRGKPLAGKSTLNRLELSPTRAGVASRYKKIPARQQQIETFFVETFLQLHDAPPAEIILDLDATDDPVHGHQAGRFFHGYYGHYCYLPLYIFCGEHLLCAKLRPADIDAAAGALKQVARIVAQLRARWPQVKILLRGDGGFCRENLMGWCEANGVDFLFGLPKNQRLTRIIGGELHAAKVAHAATGQAARVFKDFTYRTRKSWQRERRVVGKAEHLERGANPRFVVTSLSSAACDMRTLYEERYCGRGEMENRLKEQQLYLFADRTSCQMLRANQLRLWFSSVAYTLLQALRKFALPETPLAQARCDTIRLKLLKIGALVRVSVRRVTFALASGYPHQATFAQVWANLSAWRATPREAALAEIRPAPA